MDCELAMRPDFTPLDPMTPSPKHVAILGSTGSIGVNTLDVIRSLGDQFRVAGLSAHRNVRALREQAGEFAPDWIAITGPEAQGIQHVDNVGQVYHGADALTELVQQDAIDIVVAAIVGSAGMHSTLAALEAGKTVALANKETLVAAGHLAVDLVQRHHGSLIPIDSEHSAVFQALQCGRATEVERVILTASGGPFRNHSLADMRSITVEQALDHPNWKMGPKVTIDSATMMNKALEIVEARWLFDLEPDQIDVAIHPQSIIHSLVEFKDGSVMAQMSPPDMRLPIQSALTWPRRFRGPAARLDWQQTIELEMHPPDLQRFPALELGFEVARRGGSTGVVVNAANEAAVQAFLDGKLPFLEIVEATRKILDHHEFDPNPDYDSILQLDRWARNELNKWALMA